MANCKVQVLPGPPGCAAERLLKPSNSYVCDGAKAMRNNCLINKYKGGATCLPSRPGYNPSCPVPLWSRTRKGYQGAVPYTGPYDKQAPYHYAESPYYMDNDDPRKYFISGYAGFVPNAQKVIGKVFPLATNKGLRKFTDMSCEVKQNFCKPVLVNSNCQDYEPSIDQLQRCSREPLRSITTPDIGIELGCGTRQSGYVGGVSSVAGMCGTALGGVSGALHPSLLVSDGARRRMRTFRGKDPHPIYRTCEGLLPTYGGHVPRQQFRFGGTFGRETVNARNLPSLGCC